MSDNGAYPTWTNKVLSAAVYLYTPIDRQFHLRTSTPGPSASPSNGVVANLSLNAGEQPSGRFTNLGNFELYNPQYFIFFDPGYHVEESADGHTVLISYVSDIFSFNGSTLDLTPQIDSVTLDQTLGGGGTATATISGSNFEFIQGLLAKCDSEDDPCGASNVTKSILSWSPSQVIASLAADATAGGTYDV